MPTGVDVHLHSTKRLCRVFGVEGDEVDFALSVPPASDSVKVEGRAVVVVQFDQEFSRDIFKGKAHKFRYVSVEAIEKNRGSCPIRRCSIADR